MKVTRSSPARCGPTIVACFTTAKARSRIRHLPFFPSAGGWIGLRAEFASATPAPMACQAGGRQVRYISYAVSRPRRSLAGPYRRPRPRRRGSAGGGDRAGPGVRDQPGHRAPRRSTCCARRVWSRAAGARVGSRRSTRSASRWGGSRRWRPRSKRPGPRPGREILAFGFVDGAGGRRRRPARGPRRRGAARRARRISPTTSRSRWSRCGCAPTSAPTCRAPTSSARPSTTSCRCGASSSARVHQTITAEIAARADRARCSRVAPGAAVVALPARHLRCQRARRRSSPSTAIPPTARRSRSSSR